MLESLKTKVVARHHERPRPDDGSLKWINKRRGEVLRRHNEVPIESMLMAHSMAWKVYKSSYSPPPAHLGVETALQRVRDLDGDERQVFMRHVRQLVHSHNELHKKSRIKAEAGSPRLKQWETERTRRQAEAKGRRAEVHASIAESRWQQIASREHKRVKLPVVRTVLRHVVLALSTQRFTHKLREARGARQRAAELLTATLMLQRRWRAVRQVRQLEKWKRLHQRHQQTTDYGVQAKQRRMWQSANILSKFFVETAKVHRKLILRRFSSMARHVQQYWRGYLACTVARIARISRMWDEIEAMELAGLVERINTDFALIKQEEVGLLEMMGVDVERKRERPQTTNATRRRESHAMSTKGTAAPQRPQSAQGRRPTQSSPTRPAGQSSSDAADYATSQQRKRHAEQRLKNIEFQRTEMLQALQKSRMAVDDRLRLIACKLHEIRRKFKGNSSNMNTIALKCVKRRELQLNDARALVSGATLPPGAVPADILQISSALVALRNAGSSRLLLRHYATRDIVAAWIRKYDRPMSPRAVRRWNMVQDTVFAKDISRVKYFEWLIPHGSNIENLLEETSRRSHKHPKPQTLRRKNIGISSARKNARSQRYTKTSARGLVGRVRVAQKVLAPANEWQVSGESVPINNDIKSTPPNISSPSSVLNPPRDITGHSLEIDDLEAVHKADGNSE